MNAMTVKESKAMLDKIIPIAKCAGEAILSVYRGDDFDVQIKGDESPLTKADLAAHEVIEKSLAEAFPLVPCLSEESAEISFEERKKWDACFIVDPLDGTKEFIARNDDFTVNIALIESGRPVLGVIYVPVFDTYYYAARGVGAFKKIGDNPAQKISIRKLQKKDGKNHFTVVASRRHGVDKVERLCQNFASYDLTSRGSSLKMCLVAEGEADLYPRLALTSEWDTAAAQSIVEEAGGQLLQLDFSPMTYNQKESLLNPFFLVLGDPEFDWQANLVLPES